MVRCCSGDHDVIRLSHVSSVVLVIALLATGDTAAGAGEARSDGKAPVPAPATLRVALLVDGEVSKPAIRTMRTEADRIWASNAVAIEWLIPGEASNAPADVVALVGPDSRTRLQAREKDQRTLGCFRAHRQDNGVPVIIVFPERATQMVRGWMTGLGARSPAGWLEERTGTLLGRVLAHEIGHYLIGPGHTEAGLMRAQFEYGDLWSDQPDEYSLTGRAPEFLSSSSQQLPFRSRAAPRSEPTAR
jgi:hypothetical protein